jgi:hypothetical protein
MSYCYKDRNPKCESKKEPDPNHRTQCSLGQAGLIKPQKVVGFGNIRNDTTGHRPVATTFAEPVLMPFEILNRAFVFLRCCLALESAEIFSFARSRIFLARIQPILAGFQFSNHERFLPPDILIFAQVASGRYPESLRAKHPVDSAFLKWMMSRPQGGGTPCGDVTTRPSAAMPRDASCDGVARAPPKAASIPTTNSARTSI